MNDESVAVHIDTEGELLTIEVSYSDINTFRFFSNDTSLSITLLVDFAITDISRIPKEICVKVSNELYIKGFNSIS